MNTEVFDDTPVIITIYEGAPGKKGDKGDTGEHGEQGEQGIQGVAGPIPVIQVTSASSHNTSATGPKTFEVGPNDLAVGMYVQVVSASTSRWMIGFITAKTETSLTVQVGAVSAANSTLLTDWLIGLAGFRGATGAQGTQGIQGIQGVEGPQGPAFVPFADPDADRIVFWDDSAGTWMPLTLSVPMVISGTSMGVSAASETLAGKIEIATQAETTTGTDDVRAITPLKLQQKIGLLPFGVLGSAFATTTQSTITTTDVAITGLSVSFTTTVTKLVEVNIQVVTYSTGSDADVIDIKLKDNGTEIARWTRPANSAGASTGNTQNCIAIESLAAGSHVLTVSVVRVAGAGEVRTNPDATNNQYLVAKAIG